MASTGTVSPLHRAARLEHSRFARPLVGFGLGIVVLLVIGNTLSATLAAYNPVPIWDGWAIVSHLQQYYAGTYRLPMLWEEHNEHRIFTVRLVMFADYLLFRGLGLLPITLNILAPATAGVLLFRLAATARPFRRMEGWALGSLIAILLASAQQVAGFAEPFSFANMGIGVLVLAAILLTVRGQTGWAVMAGLAASGMLASGLLIWPIMLFLTARLGQGWRRTGLIAAVACGVIALYFHDYVRPPSSGDTTLLLRHPLHVFSYFCLYLGNILGKLGWPGAGLFGFAGAVFTLWMSLRLLLKPQSLTPGQQTLVAFLAFGFGAAILTAIGRGDSILIQAFSARYTTATLHFWAALACLVWTLGPFARRWQWILAVGTAVFVFAVLAPQEKMGKIVRREAETKDMAALAATVGVADPELMPVLSPDTAGVFAAAAVLREHRWANFATFRAGLLGRTIGRDLPLAPQEGCHGGIDSALPVAGALRLEGWAITADRPHVPSIVVIANDNGEIVGLAHPARGQRSPPRRQDGGVVRPLDWRGYAKSDGTTAYAVLGRATKGACLLGRLRPPAG